MRPIHVVTIDKARPAVILTREQVRDLLTSVTVAPITSTVRDIPTEVAVGPDNGLNDHSVISCDNIMTVPVGHVGRQIGWLLAHQEPDLARAITHAFALRSDFDRSSVVTPD